MATSQASNFRVQIRGNENSSIIFGNSMHNNFHFILRTEGKNLRVFYEWNSWGWYARSFSAVDRYDPKKTYKILRRSGTWDKNAPAFHEIKPGDMLVTDINLIDGTWKIEPPLEKEAAHRLMVTGHFSVKESTDSKKLKVWTGELSSEAEEIVLQKECVPVLTKN